MADQVVNVENKKDPTLLPGLYSFLPRFAYGLATIGQ